MAFVVGELSAPITLDDKGFKAGLDSVNKAGKTAAEQVSESFKRTGSQMKDVGKTLTTRVTLPIAGIGAAAIRAGMDFDTQMSKVQAISGATGSDLAALREKAKEMGAATRFSATESAEALEYMALAGWDTQQMLDGLPGVLDLAAAGALDLGLASDIVTDGMSMFQMEASEAARMSDVLATAQAKANTNVEQLGEALKMGGATAAAASMDIEQTSAILGVLADNGFKGSQAGTILDNMFRDLRNSAEDGAIAIGDANIELYDAQGNMRSLTDIMADVEKATEGMTGAQRDQALAAVFQSRSMRGVNAILGTGTDAIYELEEALYNSEGAAGEMAATMEDNLGGSLTELKSALEGAAISLYELGEGPLRSVIDWVTDLVRKFLDMDDSTKQIIMIIAGLAAAIGPLLIVGGALVSAIGALIPVFTALAGPIGLVVAAVGAAVAAGIWLYQNWETVKAKMEPIFEAFSPLIETMKNSFQTLMDSLGPIWESLKQLFESLKPILMSVGAIIGGVLAVQFGIMISLFNAAVAAIGPLINAVINFGEFVVNVFNAIIALLTGDFAGAWDFLVQAGEAALAMFGNLWESIKNLVMTFVESIIGFFKGLYDMLVGNSIIPDMVNGIIDWFKNMGKLAKEKVKEMIKAVIDFFVNMKDNAVQRVQDMVQAARDKFNNMKNAVRERVQAIINSVRDKFNSMRDAIRNIFESIKSRVSDAISNVRTRIRDGINKSLDFVRNIKNRFKEAGKNIVTAIADGIKNAVGKVTGAITDVVSRARDFLPFSPAKEGPLKDIDKLNFADPISGSIKDAIPQVEGKLQALLNVPQPEVVGVGGPAVQTSNDDAVYELNIEIPLDGETIAKKTVRFTARELEGLKRRERRKRG